MTITNRPRVGGPATNDEVSACPIRLFSHAANWPRSVLTASRRRSPYPRRTRQWGPDSAHRPERHGQDLPAQFDQRGPWSRTSPLQREPDFLRRPRGVSLPRRAKASVRFLETPATVWGAESVLIDEIAAASRNTRIACSRSCTSGNRGARPHQAALPLGGDDPCSSDQSGGEEPRCGTADPALADRFAVVLEVGDWVRRATPTAGSSPIPPAKAPRLTMVSEETALAQWQEAFAANLGSLPLSDCRLRVRGDDGAARRRHSSLASPRAPHHADTAGRYDRERVSRRMPLAPLPVMRCSEPCWTRASHSGHGARHKENIVDKMGAAHRLAWDATMLRGRDKWLHHFHLQRALDRKAQLLLERCPDPDTGTLAVEQLLANEPRERAAAFAFAAYPASVAGDLPIGAEAVNNLGRFAQPMLKRRRPDHLAGAFVGAEHDASRDGELCEHASASRRRAPRTCPAAPLLLPGQQAQPLPTRASSSRSSTNACRSSARGGPHDISRVLAGARLRPCRIQ